MAKRRNQPIALTIAGSDSGGGAGIQADLKTFAALRVHGTSAITCVTAQNPTAVLEVEACSPGMVRRQIEAVFAQLAPAAVKTGMLGSPEIVRVIVEHFAGRSYRSLVVDPVMAATSGASLMPSSMLKGLDELLALARIITPNLDEAGVLIGGKKLASVEDMRAAARQLHARYGCAVLVKGGHLTGLSRAVDVLRDGKAEFLLGAPFVRGASTHGTGCTYSAAIAAYLARGFALLRSVRMAKQFITQAIAQSYWIGRHHSLNSFWH
ncbi:MAG: bifunctional hydroxymethylpyrimidine kinase/phosphomethylpyrimidine kinase [Verrucomicrobiota bacterium]